MPRPRNLERDREIIRLCFIERRSQPSIAKTVGCSLSWVEHVIAEHRARQRVRREDWMLAELEEKSLQKTMYESRTATTSSLSDTMEH